MRKAKRNIRLPKVPNPKTKEYIQSILSVETGDSKSIRRIIDLSIIDDTVELRDFDKIFTVATAKGYKEANI